ncbi:DUF397 domain-containing protein [Actinokineospora xionganensis]|uniref:DUF397 domain-containing protein n=1 Tax=Actinokineospora xionganensis TaxID=2684470 RepID=A0ABR7LEP9_9PSEU|nr:DUF397 domain-containing protein [Actinokineospora xionganensis]MBC6451166.1 DUF397 domain-containing protein [Actinokineospora xionganensis]
MHAKWRKSSFSQPNEANCVEVAWRKSTFSAANEAACVEIAYSTDLRVRDSKNPDGGTLRFPDSSWSPQRLADL